MPPGQQAGGIWLHARYTIFTPRAVSSRPLPAYWPSDSAGAGAAGEGMRTPILVGMETE